MAADVASGSFHSCARLAAGGVRCWGDNTFGQLGNGSTTTAPVTTPVAVLGVADAIDVRAGSYFTCARRASGVVSCWGANERGQLGDGTTANRSTHVAVTGISDATRLDVGGRHACVVVRGGALQCWGVGNSGQLGNDTLLDSLVPDDVLPPP
jgi:alpha-tubulin suppressor-like RCC1 family protein